jgi:hypothetical protein
VTWAFAYFACFIVGLVLAAVSGLIRDLQLLARPNVLVPHSPNRLLFINLLRRRLAAGLILSGLVGLVLAVQRGVGSRDGLLRRPCATALSSRYATVVKDIEPGGYGQVRVERNGVAVLLAAQNADRIAIRAGSDVEVVDCTRSVITVRLPSRP